VALTDARDNRANLSQARQGDLERDLDMHGSDFNLATSIFFVGMESKWTNFSVDTN
jgi:hypothetical protein